MDRDLVMGGWQRGKVSINVYPFQGIALFNESVEEYFYNSLALIDKDVRHDIFHGNHPIYTKVRFRVPTYYGETCKIENCLIADGCVLEGEVEDSVLSSVALIVAAWVGTGALAGAAALLGVTSCRSAAAWVRAAAI